MAPSAIAASCIAVNPFHTSGVAVRNDAVGARSARKTSR